MTSPTIFPIAICTAPGDNMREMEREIKAHNVVEAINTALAMFVLKDDELLHVIHVGVPRVQKQFPCALCGELRELYGMGLCEACSDGVAALALS